MGLWPDLHSSSSIISNVTLEKITEILLNQFPSIKIRVIYILNTILFVLHIENNLW